MCRVCWDRALSPWWGIGYCWVDGHVAEGENQQDTQSITKVTVPRPATNLSQAGAALQWTWDKPSDVLMLGQHLWCWIIIEPQSRPGWAGPPIKRYPSLPYSQQARGNNPILVQRRATVSDAGPTLNHDGVNVHAGCVSPSTELMKLTGSLILQVLGVKSNHSL